MLDSPNKTFLSGRVRLFLILFIIFDLSLSFNQYYNSPIDGDITSIVLPTAKYKAVLHDPSGIGMITTNTRHTEPNRFFALAFIHEYFRIIPFAVQSFLSPISSIYFSSALIKILTQVLILLMIGLYTTGKISLRNDKFILVIALATVFFQVGGYSATMGIIDSTVSYTVYYSLSFGLTLVLLFPLMQKNVFKKEKNSSIPLIFLYFLLAIILPFMGNLTPLFVFAILISGIVGKIIFKIDLAKIIESMKSDRKYMFVLILFVILCFYSYFISLYNAERNIQDLPLIERISKIPSGLKNIIFGKPGLWILSVLILTNIFILKKWNPGSIDLNFLKWFSLFLIIYILLLPLDGYYDFRPNIIRRDNFLPIIFILLAIFIGTILTLINALTNNPQKLKLIGAYLFSIMLLYTAADSPSLRIDNCQRASLEMLSVSNEKIVQLSDKCNLASWYLAMEVKDSEVNAQVFHFWRITKEPKYYYQH